MERKNIALAILIALIVVLAVAYTTKDEVALEGYVQVEVQDVKYDASAGYVLLGNECEKIMIAVSGAQAVNIEVAWKDIETERPLTHELMKNIIKEKGSEVSFVKVTELVESTYYGVVVLDESTEIDARPSDAIALALLNNVGIYVNKELLTNICVEGVEIPSYGESVNL